jgi:hypothetical protein
MEGMDRADSNPNEPDRQVRRDRPWVKRRWAIMRGAGGGVAVIAVAGAIALSDPTDQVDTGGESAGSGTQVEAES